MDALAEPAAAATPLLSLRGVSKRFGSLQALADVSFDIAPAEIHALLGENGAGKSTLCNLIFGVHQPDAGEMLFDGRPHHPASPAQALARGIAICKEAPEMKKKLDGIEKDILDGKIKVLEG